MLFFICRPSTGVVACCCRRVPRTCGTYWAWFFFLVQEAPCQHFPPNPYAGGQFTRCSRAISFPRRKRTIQNLQWKCAYLFLVFTAPLKWLPCLIRFSPFLLRFPKTVALTSLGDFYFFYCDQWEIWWIDCAWKEAGSFGSPVLTFPWRQLNSSLKLSNQILLVSASGCTSLEHRQRSPWHHIPISPARGGTCTPRDCAVMIRARPRV